MRLFTQDTVHVLQSHSTRAVTPQPTALHPPSCAALNTQRHAVRGVLKAARPATKSRVLPAACATARDWSKMLSVVDAHGSETELLSALKPAAGGSSKRGEPLSRLTLLLLHKCWYLHVGPSNNILGTENLCFPRLYDDLHEICKQCQRAYTGEQEREKGGLDK